MTGRQLILNKRRKRKLSGRDRKIRAFARELIKQGQPPTDALTDYLRMRMRETGFARRILPLALVKPADLDKEVI